MTSLNSGSGLRNSYEEIYEQSIVKLRKMSDNQTLMQIFYNYHSQISTILNKQLPHPLNNIQLNQKYQISNKQQQESTSTQQIDSPCQVVQPSYNFLRNIWKGKYCTKQIKKDYDSEDHIDKINKVVAMMKTRIGYMTKKQNYLYDKDQSKNSYLWQNPTFMKIKEQFQRLKMTHEELIQQNQKKVVEIQALKQQKFLVQGKYQNLKKKHQQIQKNWIQVSKKNISLEQQCISLKSQINTKSRLNQLRQSTNPAQLSLYSSLQLKNSLSFKKLTQQSSQKQLTQRISSQQKIPNSDPKIQLSSNHQPQDQKSASNPLQNIFIDITLNTKNKQPFPITNSIGSHTKLKTNNRYSLVTPDNEQIQCLKDVAEQVCYLNKVSDTLTKSNNEEKDNIDKMNLERTSFNNMKYIRNQGSVRKALLSSFRSVDLAQKISIAKPKFQRTKPIYQNLLKSIDKQGPFISSKQSLENPAFNLKKRSLFTGESNMFINFKSPRKDIKLLS